MSSEKHSCGPDVPSYTIEEIQSATSEVIMKSTVSVSCGESSFGELVTAWPVAGWQQSLEFQEVSSDLRKRM